MSDSQPITQPDYITPLKSKAKPKQKKNIPVSSSTSQVQKSKTPNMKSHEFVSPMQSSQLTSSPYDALQGYLHLQDVPRSVTIKTLF